MISGMNVLSDLRSCCLELMSSQLPQLPLDQKKNSMSKTVIDLTSARITGPVKPLVDAVKPKGNDKTKKSHKIDKSKPVSVTKSTFVWGLKITPSRNLAYFPPV